MTGYASIGNIEVTDEYADELAARQRELWISATQGCSTYGDGVAAGELRGFNKLIEALGLRPAVQRASERLRHDRANAAIFEGSLDPPGI